MEKAGFKPGVGARGKTKEDALAESGISTSTANRYETLPGPKGCTAKA
jgi:hypothetical protein